MACAAAVWSPLGSRRIAPVEGASRVGEEDCRTCHEEVAGHEEIAAYHGDCEACHGGGSLHSESEEADEIRFPSSQDCLVCHASGRDTHLQWGVGEHSRAGLICSDCHDPHDSRRFYLRAFERSGFPDMDAASKLCVECHASVAARFRYPTHHGVAEGAMSCVSCHDPHEDQRVRAGDRNQLCAGCHPDFLGPWTYEHPPVTEDCLGCHDPHGSATSDLLAVPQPILCVSCHTVNDSFHHEQFGPGIPENQSITTDFPTAADQRIKPILPSDRNQAGTYLRRCTDCHGAVHGSYTDEHLRH
jgi:DmsE family decaheme c-type cytochrome